MKAVMGIGILQLLVTGLLIFKIIALETEFSELEAVLKDQARLNSSASVNHPPAFPNNSDSAKNVSVDEIRALLRVELEQALGGNSQLADQVAEIPETDPELIRDFESRIEYYLSDGAFTQEDMSDLENKIIQMTPPDRRRMMNKLTQAMSKANIQLIE